MRWRRVLLVAFLMVSMGPVLVPPAARAAVPGPSLAHGFLTDYDSTGSQVGTTRALTFYAEGVSVVVVPGRHSAAVVPAVRYAVGQLHRYGVAVRFRGTTSDRGTRPGRVVVIEAGARSDDCGGAGSTHRQGNTTPLIDDSPPVAQIESASVDLCPDVFTHPRAVLVWTALHELGHAVGLGHYPRPFRGEQQVMTATVHDPVPTSYQAGDVAGLRYLVEQQRRALAFRAVTGAVERWASSGGHVAISGWALTGHTDQHTDTYLTMDGHLVDEGITSKARPDVRRAHGAVVLGSGFAFDTFVDAGKHRFCVLASDETRPDRRLTLGCRALTVTNPYASPPASASGAPNTAPGSAAPPVAQPAAGSGSGLGGGAVAAIVAVLVAAVASVLLLVRRSGRRRPVTAGPAVGPWPSSGPPLSGPPPWPAPPLGSRPPAPPPPGWEPPRRP